jgi:hypothetical protein
MQFGCADCGPREWIPFSVWLEGAAKAHFKNAGRENDVSVLRSQPRFFARSQPFLCQHGLRVVARCPVCQRAIDLSGGANPVPIVGSVGSGKSVLSSVQAFELGRNPGDLYARMGLQCFPRGTAYRSYELQVVKRLMEHGILPTKTWPDEYHKAVYEIEAPRNAGWASRSFMFTDVAGEVYDDRVTPAVNALRTILLWARELVLVIDPCNTGNAGGMNGRQPPDILDDAQRVVAEALLPAGSVDPPHIGPVQSAIEGVSEALRQAHWPSAGAASAAHQVVLALTCRGFRGLDVSRVAATLEARREHARVLTNSEIATWLAHYLKTNSDVELTDGKLPYTIAVAVTKSELLEAELGSAWREDIHPGRGAGAADWARELNRVSQWSRERLIEFGQTERALVQLLENKFANVGYFFVSALGRDTALRVRSRTSQSNDSSLDGCTAATPQAALSRTEPWWVVSREVSVGADGTRCPTPVGVLNPLLWLLCQAGATGRRMQ